MTPTLSTAATAFAALLAVLGLIWVAARALRATRLGAPQAEARGLAVRAVLALDARRRVYLIGCDDRAVLVLTGGGNDVVLGWLPPEPAP